MRLREFAAAALILGLAACGTTPPRATPAAVPAAEAQRLQDARQAAPWTQADWSLAGRVAIRNAGKGGSGRIEWAQTGPETEVSLSAPVTRQSWQLKLGPAGARLDGLEGGPRTGGDAAQLLHEATGWVIPVDSLRYWLRGLADPHQPADAEAYDAEGRMAGFSQGGWTIAYQWPETSVDRPMLPKGVEAVRGEARVRLRVDDWQLAADVREQAANDDVSP
ncbi:outer membrane lipoprotein LolB [Pseudoxanthomonas kalamensis DSM 18571]|uniref:lipoprotein insertase outer membrane protein LolB n=1 Tax=Pseudoxanthomonas kalamensis TaxID=289483 RepID=UPI001391B69B|nr:lipoprotein insertase outer membrane protein LolB [Pseudoxanthomonas kalamensis]KAF1708781.1 outer membrane lipoprotein LolB [Pseudoxanthomonas kalamensis DSM 18571]